MEEAKKFYEEQRRKLKAMEYIGFLTDWDLQTEAPRGSIVYTVLKIER